MKNRPIYVIVPSYNEKIDVLRSTLLELIQTYPNFKVLVIDDGSTQDIRPLLADLPVIVFRHKINLGKGAALQTTRSFLLNREKDLIVLHFDADGQHDVHSLETLIEPILKDEADVVLGSRFMEGSNVIEIPTVRKNVLKIARIVNGLLTGLWLSDAHNGLRALNYNALEKINLTQNRFAYATEFVSLIKQAKLRFCEVPVSVKYTSYSIQKGQRSMGAFDIIFDLLIKKILR
jgi:glycosyltransferase involved in cell wall biosynthesis